ncbi:MAG: hypothetical protein NT062_23590 [Proteobacteria bacterium]|nr:hypothetical protein [Pseudomonadota bacterium]
MIVLVALVVASCGKAQTTPTKASKLAVLPAESDGFPNVARAATEALVRARVAGMTTEVSKVSLEVVQLSIECVDRSVPCFVAAGRSLAADRLLFAELAGTKKALTVTITALDVDASAITKTAKKVFASEADAIKGVAALVLEATQP